MNLFKKSLVALALSGAAVSVQAASTSFYIDLASTGVGEFGNALEACATCTGVIGQQIDFSYESKTTITAGADGITAGDAIHTVGGYGVSDAAFGLTGLFNVNRASGFLPNTWNAGFTSSEIGADATDNWGLTFDFDMTGTILTGGLNPQVNYTAGIIRTHLVKFDGANGVASTHNTFDMTVTGSSYSAAGLVINGIVAFSGNEGIYEDMFHMFGAECNGVAGADSFEELTNCVPDAMEVAFRADFNTDGATAFVPTGVIIPGTVQSDSVRLGDVVLAGNHNGSIGFAVPVPAPLALMGLGLVGLGFARRKMA